MNPSEILKRPYARILTPDPDGRVTAEIMEFPGCVAYGDDAAQALANLESVAVDWIAAAVEQGQDIPEPMDNADYSGRLVLRMSRGLHHRAALCAERDGVSLNHFIVTCLAECVGTRARQQHGYLQPVASAQFANYYHLSVAFIAVPHQLSGDRSPPSVTASSSGNQMISFPVMFAREPSHARG